MTELLILVQAHNEQDQIKSCVESLQGMVLPKDFESQIYIILDRCIDQTKSIVQELGVNFLEKNYSGDYRSHTANNLMFALDNVEFGDYILKCDADIPEIPEDILLHFFLYMTRDKKRISPEIKSKSGKWWLDLLFRLSDLNRKITPLGKEPRGGFCLFARETVEKLGFDKSSSSWDTGFDNRIKEQGWTVFKMDHISVVERRDFTLRHLIKRQMGDGRARRKMRLSFKRVLLHSIFRGRPFVLYGYIQEMLSDG